MAYDSVCVLLRDVFICVYESVHVCPVSSSAWVCSTESSLESQAVCHLRSTDRFVGVGNTRQDKVGN